MYRRQGTRDSPRWLIRVLLLAAATAALNIVLYGTGAGADHGPNNYAIIEENSNGAYRGIRGLVHTGYPPPLTDGAHFTNQTLWAVDTDNCGQSWVETGWSRRDDWGGQVKYKFMYSLPITGCQFRIWPLSLGTPANWSVHAYTLVYCDTCWWGTYWDLYIDGTLKGRIRTDWVFAEKVQAGGEVNPPPQDMGPTGVDSLGYQTSNGVWVLFNYHDRRRCDFGYNLIYNAGIPYFIYDWGYDTGGPGCPP